MDFPFEHPSYRARCTKVVDGDTVDLVVDVGFRTTVSGRFRLLGIDTPELNSKDPAERALAVKAKDQVAAWLKPSQNASEWPVNVVTRKDPDNFGRWLVMVMVFDENGQKLYVNQRLRDLGLATEYKG